MVHQIILLISLTLNFIFLMSSHPMMITLIIIMQTLMMCILVFFFSSSLWFSYILFLTFLGGMLILFIYITTLASNEKFEMNSMKIIISFISFSILSMMLIYFFDTNYSMMMYQDSLMSQNFFNQTESPNNLHILYNKPNYKITLMMMMYLLITLIIVVIISSPKSGSLRHMI